MTYNVPTIHDLTWLLLQMGFTPIATTGSHGAFRHQATDTIVVLPSDDADERMRVVHVVAIKKTVIDRGVIDDASFDQLLRKSAEAPLPPTVPVS